MDIIRRRRSADRATYLPIAPPEIADAPPHQEIEVLLAFCIVNVIAAGSGEFQITRRFVPGEIFPVPFTNGHTETIYRPLALLEFGGYCLWSVITSHGLLRSPGAQNRQPPLWRH